jgi:hypothetical protein
MCPRRLHSFLAICSYSEFPSPSLVRRLGIHVSIASKLGALPFGTCSPNLDIIAIPAIHKVPCESDLLAAFYAGVGENTRRGKAIPMRVFGWKGKRLSDTGFLGQSFGKGICNFVLPLVIRVKPVEGGRAVFRTAYKVDY